MPPIQDKRLARIYETNSCPDLPRAVVSGAARLIRLLFAARSWSDIGVFTRVAQLPNGQFAAPVHGRWAVVFDWDDTHEQIARPELRRL